MNKPEVKIFSLVSLGMSRKTPPSSFLYFTKWLSRVESLSAMTERCTYNWCR